MQTRFSVMTGMKARPAERRARPKFYCAELERRRRRCNSDADARILRPEECPLWLGLDRLRTIFLDACGIIIQHRIHAGADAPASHGFRPQGFQKIEKGLGFSEARIEPQIVVFLLQNGRHTVVYAADERVGSSRND
jgi:hypothetical protein